MNRKQVIAAVLITLLLGSAGIAGYLFFKPHRSLENSPVTRVRADSLYLAFQQDEPKANAAYLDKALEVSGTIASMQTNQQGQAVIILDSGDPMGGVACTMTGPVPVLEKNQAVLIRGFCSGYLSDVVLRDGILVNH